MGILSKSKADDFNLIYKRLAPLSHYGKELKNKFLQFSNDDYKLAKSYFRKLEKVINWEKNNKSKIQYIRAKLEKITDIDQYLNSLESQELFNVNFYQLRKFANNSYDILEELNESFFKEDFYKYYLDLSKVKNIFDKFCDKPLGFHISSQKFKKLKEIKNAIETKTIKKQSIKKNRKKHVSDLLSKNVGEKFKVSIHSEDKDELMKLSYLSVFKKDNENIILEFINDKEIIEIDKDISNFRNTYIEVEIDIKYELYQELTDYFATIRELIEKIAKLDLFIAKSNFHNEFDMCLPKIVKYQRINITAGYHPLIKEELNKKNEEFTPRSINISGGVAALTGINMGGKTITLRLINLIVRLVSYGMPVPARDCSCSLFEFIYFRTKDNNTIETGLSLFGSEIKDLQFAIDHKNQKGLVILDEIASGANPELGRNIVYSFVEEMQDSSSIIIFTTHYSGLSQYKSIQRWKTKGIRSEIKSSENIDIKNISRLIDYSLTKDDKDYSLDDILKVIDALGLDKSLLKRIENRLVESRCIK